MKLITEQNIAFLEEFNTPKAFTEIMFSNFDNPAVYSQDKFGEVRLYQEPFLSDESIIDFEATTKYNGLNKKQEFQLRKQTGDIYLFGARRFGKSLIVEKMDLLNSMVHIDNITAAFGSVDLIHINEILDSIKNAFQNHPILKLWERSIKGAPNYKFQLKNNHNLQSVNFNIGSKSPGKQWYGKHVSRAYLEEASLETEEVYKKRLDAVSEFGAVIRSSGMTNFTTYSPAGLAFYGKEEKKHVINYPQFVNPFWDEAEKKRRLKQYGGEDALNYRVFVKGEVVTDGIAFFDMDRVREACYVPEIKGKTPREIKRFEITKERFPLFKSSIVVERPVNAERIFINSDVGKNVNEIIVHSEIGNKYDYLYNIVLYNLTVLEKYEIYKYIIEKLQANVIGFDCGDGEGRALYSMAERDYPKENLVYYDGSMKLNVDFTYDEKKNIIMEKGEPVYRQEYMSEFSMHRLANLLYGGRFIIPVDYKFDSQFSVVMSMISGTRTKFRCVSESGDHLLDAHRVMAIAQWIKKDFNTTPKIENHPSAGAVGTISF